MFGNMKVANSLLKVLTYDLIWRFTKSSRLTQPNGWDTLYWFWYIVWFYIADKYHERPEYDHHQQTSKESSKMYQRRNILECKIEQIEKSSWDGNAKKEVRRRHTEFVSNNSQVSPHSTHKHFRGMRTLKHCLRNLTPSDEEEQSYTKKLATRLV